MAELKMMIDHVISEILYYQWGEQKNPRDRENRPDRRFPVSDRLVTVIWKPAVNETDRPDLFNYGFFVYLVIPSLSLYRFQYFIPSLSRLPLGLLSGRSLMLLIGRSIQVSYFYFDFMFDVGSLIFCESERGESIFGNTDLDHLQKLPNLFLISWNFFFSFCVCVSELHSYGRVLCLCVNSLCLARAS